MKEKNEIFDILCLLFSVYVAEFSPPQVNYWLNERSPNIHHYIIHVPSEEQLKKPRGDHLFAVEFLSATQLALFLEAGSGELAWAQVTVDEFSGQMETWSHCPDGLALRLLQEEWQKDDRYIHSKLLGGGLGPIYCPQEPSPEFAVDILEMHMETMMYMCLVWICPARLHHCGEQLPQKEKKEAGVIHHGKSVLPPSVYLPRLQGWSPSCEISFSSSLIITEMPFALEKLKEFHSSPFISTCPEYIFLI